MSAVTDLLGQLQEGTKDLEAVAATLAKRKWSKPRLTSDDVDKAYAATEDDPEPFAENSWAEVEAARVREDITPEQYQALFAAVEKAQGGGNPKAPVALTGSRHVRTPEGARKYGEPVGSLIVKDLLPEHGGVDTAGPAHQYLKRVAELTAELDGVDFGKTPNGDLDRAADQGPGEHALRHLEVLKKIGAEIKGEVSRRVLNTEETPREKNMRARLAQLDPEVAEKSKEAETKRTTEVRAYLDELLDDTLRTGSRADGQFLGEVVPASMRSSLVDVALQDSKFVSALEEYRGKFSQTMDFGLLRRVMIEVKSRADLAKNKESQSELAQLKRDQKNLADTLTRENKEQTARIRHEVMREVRPMGGQELVYEAEAAPNLTEEHVQWATDHYPKDWLTKRARWGPVVFQEKERRGWFKQLSTGSSLIELGTKDLSGEDRERRMRLILLHEIGHDMEETTRAIKVAEWAFHHSRTSTGDVGSRKRERLRRLVSLAPGSGYGSAEKAMKDKFTNPYSGRVYEDSPTANWELFTTGMESLYAGSNYLDPEFETFMYGVLAAL